MKKKIKCFLPVLACLVLLSGLFVMPVSAAGTGWGTYSYTAMEFMGGEASLYRFQENTGQLLPPRFITDGNAGISTRYKLTYPIMYNNGISQGDICAVRIPFDVTEVTCSSGDVYSITIENLSVAVDPSVGTFTGITLWFGEKVSTDNGYSWYNFNYLIDKGWTDGTPGNYYFNDLSVTHSVQNDSKVTLRYIMIHFIYNGIPSGSSGSVTFSPRGGFHFGYGNPNSPEAPKYNKPDDGGAVGDLEDLEGQVGEQSQQGMDSANDTFKGFGTALSEFTLGLQFVSVLMRTFIFKMPWLNALFTISLGLGLFGFIVGLAGYAIGAADRKASREARRAEREARRKK